VLCHKRLDVTAVPVSSNGRVPTLTDQPNVTAYQCDAGMAKQLEAASAASSQRRISDGKGRGELRTTGQCNPSLAWPDIGWAIYARVGLITVNIGQVPTFSHK